MELPGWEPNGGCDGCSIGVLWELRGHAAGEMHSPSFTSWFFATVRSQRNPNDITLAKHPLGDWAFRRPQQDRFSDVTAMYFDVLEDHCM